MDRRKQQRFVLGGTAACLAVVSTIWLPLFHVVPLKTATAEKAAATFDPARFAAGFWTNQLVPALAQAVKAPALLAAIRADAAAARTNYSHRVGLGESYYFFLSGTGRVVAMSDDDVSLAVPAGGTNVDVSLQTDLVFGNALRDGTGLLNVNDYPNSRDFNDISEALNHIAETQVLPALREHAKVGVIVSFAGCAEVDDESTDLKPLKVIPIRARVQ
jgi:predicted lipoprotein